jgi:trans-aconitate methyltransferase
VVLADYDVVRAAPSAVRSSGRTLLSDFSSIARIYRQTATAQKSAAERLFWMLGIERTDDVLDLGCGTGHLSQEIRLLTDGRVVGMDLSPEMIALAREAASGTIEFVTGDAEALGMTEEFDAILCNSAFQWFADEPGALAGCFQALRPGGRMAMQAPAREDYCPTFLRAVGKLADDPRTSATWARFRSPWTFYETADEYGRLFTDAAFALVAAEMEELREHATPERVLDMFESGAAAAYLNPACYEGGFDHTYADAARELILRDFEAQAGADGHIDLLFHRVYVLARRP